MVPAFRPNVAAFRPAFTALNASPSEVGFNCAKRYRTAKLFRLNADSACPLDQALGMQTTTAQAALALTPLTARCRRET